MMDARIITLRKALTWGAALSLSTAFAGLSHAQGAEGDREGEAAVKALKWQNGPSTGRLGKQAEIKVPSAYQFLPSGEARKFLELHGNIVDSDVMGVLQPRDEDWFVVFEFADVGYVKDDEKSSLDADAMLKAMKEGDEPSNKERRKAGLSAMTTVGWASKPAYNDETHNLEWAIRIKSESHEFVNHHTKILGRHGYTNVTWVGDTDQLSDSIPQVRSLLEGFSYTSGNKYAEFRSGDKIAKYGLTALITGGAAAVALKTGILQKLLKPILVGLVVVGGAISAFFKKLFGRKSDN